MFEIFTYGNGIMLGSLLQAVAALTATDDYRELIRLIFIITTMVVVVEISWTGKFTGVGRLLTIIFLMFAAILTRADVQITDRVNSANDSLVANVPVGLAAPLAITTAIGDWGTGAFETIFSLPNDLRYQTNGLLFASRLTESSTQFEITDARMANNLAEFAQGCIYYGMMAGWFTIDTVMESGDIWAALPAGAFGNAIFVQYEDAGGNVTMDGCRNVRTLIEGDWATAVDEMASVYGQRIFPDYTEANAKARLLSSIPQSYQYLSSIADSAADIIRQNAMINAMKRSFTNLANNAGSPGAAQDYALAQAEAQQRTTYATLGAMAGRMMSLFSNVLETLIYGIFPIAFAFILIALMQGKAVLMYLKLLFWLQLWPPMFAILNFAMSSYAADATTAAAMQAGGGASVLNMLTYTGMRAVNSDMSAMAGYLSWMIPMFSWAVVSGSGFAASQLASSLGSVAQSSGSTAASAASTGNISLGNYSAYNSRMFQQTASPSMNRGLGSHVNPNTGATHQTSAGGFHTMSTMANSTPFAANLASSLKSTVSTSATRSVQAAKNAVSGFMTQTASTFSNMQKLAQATSAGRGTSSGSDTGQSNQFEQKFAQMQKLVDQFANKHGMSKGQAASMLLAASMDSKSFLPGQVAALATGLSGSGRMDFAGKSDSKEAWEAAKTFAQDNNFGEKWSSSVNAGTRQSEQSSAQKNDSQSKDIQAGFNRQKAATSNLQSSLSEAQAWQRLAANLRETGASGSVDAVGALIAYGNKQPGVNMEMLAAQSTSMSGDSAGAAQKLQGIVNGFVAQRAAQMAGVDKAPSSDGVYAANQANNAAVVTASENAAPAPGSGNVLADAGDNMAAVKEMAAAAGVPDADMVGQSADAIRAMAETRMAEQNGVITDGQGQVQAGGTPLKDDATEKTQPGNQNHMVNASGQVAVAGADVINDAVDGAKQIGGDMMDSFISPSPNSPNGRAQTAQQQEPWRGYDEGLPPPADDGAGDGSGNTGIAWVNKLD